MGAGAVRQGMGVWIPWLLLGSRNWVSGTSWVNTWMNQPYPVMLVVGTFPEEDEWAVAKEKVQFADVRWMEITSTLKRLSANGKKPVKQIEFKGERLDMSSVRSWREKVIS